MNTVRRRVLVRHLAAGHLDERWIAAAERNLALDRLGTAADVANAVAFLVSDQAAWVAGQTPMVDGGYAL